MASLYTFLMLIAALDPGFAFILEINEEKTIKWPTEYHFRGESMDVLAGIMKPFEVWYSGAANKSRVDYYGTVKHYYIAENDEEFGEEYIVFPITTEDVKNEIVCRKEKWEGKQLNVLPPTDKYILTGQEVYNDKLVETWKYLETDEDKKKIEKTLYVYKNEEGHDIPVLREIKEHNLWTGALSGHTITRYFDYSKLDPKAVDHSLDEACNDTESIRDLLPHLSHDVEEAFDRYIIHHNRKYEGDEHEVRKQIFKESWRKVVEHNKQNLGYKVTLNKFSDRTDEELAYLMATKPSPNPVGSIAFPHTEQEVEDIVKDLPESYDMRTLGYISSIKNQGSCGSCWSFSTVAAVEGALARSNGGRSIDLSEQSLVDCAWGYGDYGCDGGFLEKTYKYVLKHGIPTEQNYGLYLEENGLCKLDNVTEFYNIKGFSLVIPLSVNAMKVALYKYGPVTVTINATPIKSYSNGLFFDPTCNKSPLNHGVTIVGYGVRDNSTYWIVKNSWGTDWGLDGYILFSAINNNCHILEGGFVPIV